VGQKLTGLLPDDDPLTPAIDEAGIAYMTDRNTEKPWNDAWGQPLVIAYGLYQPPGYSPPAGATNGAFCSKALRQYQYNRSVYISLASAGTTIADAPTAAKIKSSAVADWNAAGTGILATVWNQCNVVCQPTAAEEWTAESFDRPPWQGVKRGKNRVNGIKVRSLLSSPHEFK
jgi:hypothetical protein